MRKNKIKIRMQETAKVMESEENEGKRKDRKEWKAADIKSFTVTRDIIPMTCT